MSKRNFHSVIPVCSLRQRTIDVERIITLYCAKGAFGIPNIVISRGGSYALTGNAMRVYTFAIQAKSALKRVKSRALRGYSAGLVPVTRWEHELLLFIEVSCFRLRNVDSGMWDLLSSDYLWE
jgi:hypothetical protein